MKKTFKTFALMLLTAFAFSSCVDVPAPFNLPDKSSSSGGGGSETVEGTPVTCAQAAELAKALADGATSSELYTITGYITEVVGNVSRNQQTFWMADTKDGGRVFEAFWANLPEGVSAFTKGTKVKITGKLMKFVNNSGQVTPEMKNAVVVILPDDGGETPPVDGIEVTCAEAVQLTNALADGGTSAETYTVTGYITQVLGTVSMKTGTPQQSFWMSDDKGGNNQFEAYYANVPSGVSEFVVGMKVKITGQLKKFVKDGVVTAEIQNPTVVILPDDGGETPPVDGIEVTCAEAVQLTNAMADGGTSTETYTVTGYITDTDGVVSTKTGPRQQIFWMADDPQGGKLFEAYWANVPDGVKKFTVGMKVTITGKLKKYIDTKNNNAVICEIQNGTVVILEQGDGGQGGDTPGPTPGPGGDEVTELVNGNFEEWVSGSEPLGWKSASSASSAILEQFQDSHGEGVFSCLVKANSGTNMRLATQEITLAPGTYVFSFYAKTASASYAQTRIGYVPIKTDGSVDSYKYNSAFFDINNEEWTYIENEFTLTAETKVCLLVMNPKSNKDKQYEAQDILVDDATLVKK